MAFTAAVAILVRVTFEPAFRQRRAIANLSRRGCEIVAEPSLIGRWTHQPTFRDAMSLSNADAESLTDDDWARLVDLHRLNTLSIFNANDASLRHLAPLTSLRSLQVGGEGVMR